MKRRSPYVFDEAKTLKHLTQGRGTGAGKEYVPWLRIQDLPSRGRSHRVTSILDGHVHHLLSDGEYAALMMFEADSRTRAVREQWPLLPRLDSTRAAAAIGVRHPVTLDGTPYVLTIDFYVTSCDSTGLVYRPYTFKHSFDDLTPRQREVIDIQREFFRRQGQELELIDERWLDQTLVRHWDDVRYCYHLQGLAGTSHVSLTAVASMLEESKHRAPHKLLGDWIRWAAPRLECAPTTVLILMKHCIARRVLTTDLTSEMTFVRRPLSAYRFVPAAAED
jgi:hypothetical protein